MIQTNNSPFNVKISIQRTDKSWWFSISNLHH